MLFRLIEDGKPENFQLQIYIFTRLLSQNNRDNLYNVFLFSDAMLRKYCMQDGVGGDGVAGDGRDGGDCLAKVLGN